MKKNISLVILTAMLCFHLCAQQQFTQTVSTTNTSCNTHCTIIDAPGFTYDPNALIFATSVTVNSSGSSPNLIGALYRTYERKWSIFSLSGAPMTPGAQYNLEYYPKEDANHFILTVPRRAHANDAVYIDHPGLNNNPSAQIQAFPTNPQTGNAVFNIKEIQITYDPSASKWFLANKAGEDIESGAAYNIMFASGSPTFTNPNTNKDLNGNVLTPVSGNINATNGNVNKDINGKPQTPLTNNGAGDDCKCIIPKSLPPDSAAGGDLGGNYPSPTVQKLNGRTISNTAPNVGEVLKWNGTEWAPAGDYDSYASIAVKPSVLIFDQNGPFQMGLPNVDILYIPGLNNQEVTLPLNTRFAFQATINVKNEPPIGFPGLNAVDAWLKVEIADDAGKIVGSATAYSVLGTGKLQTLVAVGSGKIGTDSFLNSTVYHTRVTLNRGPNGTSIYCPGPGQMMIEIFPVPWDGRQ